MARSSSPKRPVKAGSRRIRKSKRRKRPHTHLRTVEDFFAQAERSQDTWNRVVHVVSRMRSDGLSLNKAAKEAGVSPRTVINWSGRALKKAPNGRYSAAKRDSLLRVVQVPTPKGSIDVALRDSRHASILGQYWDAVQKYLRTGDASGIEKFRRKRILDASGAEVPLITDLKELNRLGSAGVLSFESLYARTA